MYCTTEKFPYASCFQCIMSQHHEIEYQKSFRFLSTDRLAALMYQVGYPLLAEKELVQLIYRQEWKRDPTEEEIKNFRLRKNCSEIISGFLFCLEYSLHKYSLLEKLVPEFEIIKSKFSLIPSRNGNKKIKQDAFASLFKIAHYPELRVIQFVDDVNLKLDRSHRHRGLASAKNKQKAVVSLSYKISLLEE